MDHLEILEYGQGRWREGKELAARLSELTKKKPGLEHPETQKSIIEPILFWGCLDEHDDARAFLKEAAKVPPEARGYDLFVTESMRIICKWSDAHSAWLPTGSEEKMQAKYHESWEWVWDEFREALSPTKDVA
jgi:hypothetical protein